MLSRTLSLAIALSVPCFAGSLQLNSNAFDTSQFKLTSFADGLSAPLSMVQLPDGSIASAVYSTGIVRLTDTNHDGVADGPKTTLYSSVGAHTGLVQAGGYFIDANFGDYASNKVAPTITVLKPGATPSAPWTPAGSLDFAFAPGWEHDQPGIAVRPSPGKSGSYDLVFNIGSEFDHQLSTDPVQLSGLISGTLSGDSLYAVTLDLSGAVPSASNLRKVASGIRNVIGMGFQPGTGDFYFVDNAIDGTGPYGDEPPQAEEIDRISASDFNSGVVPDFGYPNCYIQYRTGAPVGSGCTQPFFAIQPLPNGTALGSESEGVTQMAFAPANFPTGFNDGIFLGFSGRGFLTGAANEENAVGYYDFATGNYIHFSENSQKGVYQPIGIYTTANALFISDFGSGSIYEVTANTATPEPSAFWFSVAGIGVLAVRRRRLYAKARRAASMQPVQARHDSAS